jgi:salicylate hydroxylase
MGSTDVPVALRVIVVGGGIGGLASAIALRRAGHHVKVLERQFRGADDGAGIVVCANATRVLRQWGLEPESVGMLKCGAAYIAQGETLKPSAIWYTDDIHRANGEFQYMATRHDLRRLLRSEAERTDVLGEGTIEFQFDTRAVDYDAQRPAVQLSDGIWEDADLVVACDGIGSKAAKVICGFENPAKPIGRSAFRLLVPDKHLKSLRNQVAEELRQHGVEVDTSTVLFIRAEGKLCVWWICRDGEVHAFDVLLPDDEEYLSKEDWSSRCDKQILLDAFSDWHPLMRQVLETANQDPMLWKICSREPLSTLHKGKLCILG